ncbi:hypothetical protein LL309_21030 [Escherichia coli]|nr:hypothetical protein [Escherichia coli]
MQREKPPEWREKQKGSRGIRRGQRYRLVFQFPIRELVKGSKVKLIVWINEFQGIPALENIPLIETKFIEKNKDVIAGVVVIQDRKSDAFASDIKELTEKSLTLKEALESDHFGLMAKSRLKRVFNDIYKQLDSIYDDEHSE